ncbi:carbohydrate ABC transporter permease [Lacrimispora sphenoides]|uniref:Multiple sugar transport system permease protein n=1 Tax=Lacrimispora sphenoides JCM 1415 TaxID=1297793 RepID=A0ABY1C6W9_9FIRM|nr:carbohydrate ABC transporter permease [Lacrimispora sphenoides]SET75063.1 multiple sugar transport system permease protein [[Clostridium] sphenoides JCM 1415]SUY50984.1 ABC-type sugar transport system, permease component [Lacrimispora sphenoides]
MAQKTNKTVIVNTILSVLGLVWITPLIFTVLNIVKTKQEYNMGSFWQLPEGFNLVGNIKTVIESGILSSIGASLLYAVLGAGFSAFIGLLAAYALTHLRIRGKMFWFLFIYSGTIFPFQVYLIPVYKGYFKLGLYDTYLGMVLFYTAICIPFCMFVLRNFFLGISKEVCESAKIDGASDWKTLLHIFVPMAKAPLSILFLTQFTWSWNDLMFGLTFTKSTNVRPVMASMSMLSKGNAPALFLACILVSIPTIILFIFLQNNFEAGMAYTSK